MNENENKNEWNKKWNFNNKIIIIIIISKQEKNRICKQYAKIWIIVFFIKLYDSYIKQDRLQWQQSTFNQM